MGISFSHVLLVLIAVLLVFGAGRLPTVMKDLAKGLRSFKEGLKEEDDKTSLLADHTKKAEKDA